MAVERWAMIQDGTVVNVCLWDGERTTWEPPAGIEMQRAPDQVAIGWTYAGGEWVAPVVEEVPAEVTDAP